MNERDNEDRRRARICVFIAFHNGYAALLVGGGDWRWFGTRVLLLRTACLEFANRDNKKSLPLTDTYKHFRVEGGEMVRSYSGSRGETLTRVSLQRMRLVK